MKLCTSRTKGFKSLVSVGGEVAYKGLVKGNFVFFFSLSVQLSGFNFLCNKFTCYLYNLYFLCWILNQFFL